MDERPCSDQGDGEIEMAKPSKFAHVLYATRRYDEMVAWYENVFEAKVIHQDPGLAFLSYDEEHHRFAIANLDLFKPNGAPQERADVGVNHVAYTYASAAELLQTYRRLRDAGITPFWQVHHGITLSLYYRDPDGNRMEFQVDAGPPGQISAYMSGEGFAANPVGVAFDPDMLLAAYEHGAPEDELLRMPQGDPAPIPAEAGLT
jgi:catechol 2,3-dioxygenase-like lactoylglutathione lyase family enzyme